MRRVLSLRWRVVGLLVLALAPLFVLVALDLGERREADLQEAEAEALAAAETAAAVQDQAFVTTEVLLSALAEHREVHSRLAAPEACAAWLAEVRSLHPLYANLGVVERDGSVSCSAVPSERPVDLRDRYYVQGPLERNELTIGDYQVGRITGVPSINLGYPVRGADGQPEAVVFAALDLRAINDLVGRASLPHDGAILLFDQLGTLLAATPDGGLEIGRSFANSELGRALFSAESGRATSVDLDGRRVVTGIVPVRGGEGSRSFVVVTRPESTVLAAADAEFTRNLIALSVVAVSSILLGWFGAQPALLRPLRRLGVAAERLARGERGPALGPPYSRSEVGDIEATFDRMTTALHDRERELVRAEATRYESEARFARILDQAVEAIITVDGEFRVQRFNQGAETMFGTAADEALGASLAQFIPPSQTEQYLDTLRRLAESGEDVRRLAGSGLRLRRADGSTFTAEVTVSTAQDGGEPAMLLIIRDTTLQEEAKEVLRRRAFFDELTGLPNRSWLLDELGMRIESAPAEALGVFVVELPRLRDVNATFGYTVGDDLLRQVGPRLTEVCGRGAQVARLDGARFAVLVERDAREPGFHEVAAAIVAEFERPFEVRGEPVALEAWVGLALYPGHGRDAELLLRRADAALTVAPDLPAGYAIFDEGRDERRINHVHLLGELRRALDSGLLELHYQPRVELATGMPVGAEALLRWPGGPSPADFIPLAERTGLIRAIDRWVLETAVRQVATWRRRGLELPVGVNLSALSFQDARLPEQVAELLELWGLPPGLLELEITETALMADPERAADVCEGLRALGVSIAVDDFGAGHSPLTYLHRMAVSTLKIDRSFMVGLAERGETEAIVRAVVDLGKRLELTLVAEGVEDAATASILREIGCETAQGFHFCRPGSAATVEAWIADQRLQRVA